MPGSQSLSPQEEQEKLVEEALSVVKTQSFQMKRCLDKNKLMDALKHASNMLGELRTSLLSPKSYYTLYMAVCDELRHLELYLLDEFQKGHRIADLYELVQYAGNIIPRLYLLITVGIVYIKTNEMSRKDILKDLVEMCRGVQHPLRGLFLRNYLLQCTRNVLPDVDISQLTGEIDSGTVLDSIEFVLLNFAEMNKLWVRMQHQGHSRDRERREQERRELRLLVGTNLVRLAQLETIDVEKYKRLVLPNVLEQVVSCRDAIAQEYLMDCVIQVFPDDFHLQTLTIVLKACIDLHPDVNVKTIIINLIERLSQFATKPDSAGIPSDIQLFEIFSRYVQQAIETRQKLADDDVIALQVALVNLVTKCYPDRLDYVGQVLRNTVAVLKNLRVERIDAATSLGRELKRLLQLPIDFYSNVIRLLELSEPFAQLLGYFDFDGRRTLACYFLNNALDNATVFVNQQQLEQTAVIIQSLLADQPDQPPIAGTDQPATGGLGGAARGGGGPHYRSQAAAMDIEEFNEDQCLVGRWMNLCQANDDEEQYRMIESLKRAIEKGGARRLRYTMPPVVFQCYRLALQLAANASPNANVRLLGLFQFVHSTVSHFTKQESSLAETALRLYLQGVLTINQLCVAANGSEPFDQCESMAYEFLTQAISIYEEEISDTKQQLQAIQLIIGTLELLQCFATDNRDTLFSQCALTAAKLLKKPDQCRAVMLCAHLFWSGKSKEANGQELRDSKRVLECLKKGFKIAKQCMDKTVQVQLCVELLCRHVYFAVKGSEAITVQSCQQIADQVREALPNLEPSDEVEQITRHFHNTMEYLERKLKSGGQS